MTFKLNNSEAEIFVPDGTQPEEAVKRSTHMAISAHQDDIEIMAYDGILKCFAREDRWFFGVVTTNGSGSPRDGLYADYTDEDMRAVRRIEQKKAAYVGEYSAAALLDYPSSELKNPDINEPVEDLKSLVAAAAPEVIYTHNPADKHATHVAVALRTIKALRELPQQSRPAKLYGCEVWRALDWVNDNDKVVFDVQQHPNLAASLLGLFDSQVCGGARYDLAATGRRLANATFAETHDTDATTSAIYAIDLTPLIDDPTLDIGAFVTDFIERFSSDVDAKIKELGG